MKTIMLCMCLLILQHGIAQAKTEDADSWLIVRRNVTFYVAEKICLFMGGVIADIEDEATDLSVQSYINTILDLSDDERQRVFWVGRNDLAEEGIFATADGRKWFCNIHFATVNEFKYPNWYPIRHTFHDVTYNTPGYCIVDIGQPFIVELSNSDEPSKLCRTGRPTIWKLLIFLFTTIFINV